MSTFSATSNRFFRFTLLYWLAVLAGVFLWSREWEIVRLASSKQEEDLFGIFGFCIFSVIAFSAYMDFKSNKALSSRKIILLAMPFFVSLIFLSITVEFSQKSWDYHQYETAFRAIAAGNNPYLSGRYLYPPLFADVMVFVFQIGQKLFLLLGLDKSPWIFVFYIHQSSLLFFLLFSYFLSIQFAALMGVKELQAVFLVSAIYLFNVPILRTLSYNQVNFYVLTSILVALVALRKYPFLSGVSIAFGGLIKLYPFVLTMPLLRMKNWRALTGIFAGAVGISLIEIKIFHTFTLWRQFVNFLLVFPVEQESSLFRNTSPLSFLRSSMKLMDMPSSMLSPAILIVSILILFWFGVRFFHRERMQVAEDKLPMSLESFRNMGHLLDFSVLSLLIAPSAWEHHYVIAIPLAIWAFALRGRYAPAQVGIGFALVFALPVFNIFPFSYLRMLGLIVLLLSVSPHKLKIDYQ